MAILAAAIEANGWVLAVRGDWAATAGAWEFAGDDRANGRFLAGGVDQFPLDADGVPKVLLQVASAGYDRIGGQAVANAGRLRSIVATKAIRKAYPAHTQLDETDHGDGTRTVRLALSDRIYASCSVRGGSFLPGWKAGEGGGSFGPGTVANASERTPPTPIVRSAVLPYQLARGVTSTHMDWIVATHHPEHLGGELHQPLAATRVVATDGVNSVETWLTGLQTSPLYNDNLRCVGGAVNLAGLTPGVVTLIATFYPWIGTARTIGAGHVTDVAGPLPASAEVPHMICYDPEGARYAQRHLYVDAINGTTTPASVTVANDLATARAGVPAASVSVAMQALYLANITLAAGNGQTGGTRSCDWCVITLAPGTCTWGSQAVTTGFGAKEGRLIVRGDPDTPDPRADCIFEAGAAANPSLRNARWHFANLTIAAGGQVFLSANCVTTENVTVRGKVGSETATTGVFSASAAAGAYIQAHANLTWTDYGVGLSGSNQRAGLVRHMLAHQWLNATTFIGVERIGAATLPGPIFQFTDGFTDQMAWNCKLPGLNHKGIAWGISSGAGTQASVANYTRLAMVNCLFERMGSYAENWFSIGENGYSQFQGSVFEGNTMVGQRVNLHNNSPLPTVDLKHIDNVSRNNVWDRQGTKHDIFDKVSTATGSFEWLYGVGHSGNVLLNRINTEAANFQMAFPGLRGAVDTSYAGNGSNAFPKFVDDRCQFGPMLTSATGWGDYRPAAGSPLLARGAVAMVDRFADGAARGASFASGMLAGEAAIGRLSPDAAAIGMAAGAAMLRPAVAARARMGWRTLAVGFEVRNIRVDDA